MFTYNAFVTNVVDGDTIDVEIDLGFDIWHHVRLRLAGIDTPETSTQAGKDARVYAKKHLEKRAVVITTYKPDKYGRYLADVIVDGVSFNKTLIDEGMAKAYDGGKR